MLTSTVSIEVGGVLLTVIHIIIIVPKLWVIVGNIMNVDILVKLYMNGSAIRRKKEKGRMEREEKRGKFEKDMAAFSFNNTKMFLSILIFYRLGII